MEKHLLDSEEARKASIDELYELFSSSANGLSTSQAKERLGQYGYNEIVEKKVSPILKFLGYFWGPIPWMIEIAAILSAIIRHWNYAMTILSSSVLSIV